MLVFFESSVDAQLDSNIRLINTNVSLLLTTLSCGHISELFKCGLDLVLELVHHIAIMALIRNDIFKVFTIHSDSLALL